MTQQTLFKIAKYLLAISMIVFGLNKFLFFAAVDPPADPTAQQFLGTMFSSYLATFVGIIEILGGILLLIPRFSFVGLLVLLPIVTNIIGFHLAHDLPGNGLWLAPSLMTILVAVSYKNQFAKLLLNK